MEKEGLVAKPGEVRKPLSYRAGQCLIGFIQPQAVEGDAGKAQTGCKKQHQKNRFQLFFRQGSRNSGSDYIVVVSPEWSPVGYPISQDDLKGLWLVPRRTERSPVGYPISEDDLKGLWSVLRPSEWRPVSHPISADDLERQAFWLPADSTGKGPRLSTPEPFGCFGSGSTVERLPDSRDPAPPGRGIFSAPVPPRGIIALGREVTAV